MIEHIETVIIGAGQAGLTTGYHLRKRGRPFVIHEANARVGDRWRRHWDTLRLYSPALYDGLPGMRFPADGWSYPDKDAVAAFLDGNLRWLDIAEVLDEVLDLHDGTVLRDVDSVIDVDRRARKVAQKIVKKRSGVT